MNNYYTYAYLREDGTPYYIGKGINGRAYSSYRTIPKPRDKDRIIFLKQNLTEEEAFKHEKYMIAVLGRKDLGTGILRNLTEGGDGTSGFTHSEETKLKMKSRKHTEESKRKISEALSGKNNPNFGKPLSEETKRKISESQKGEKHHGYWKLLSEEHKRKLSEAKSGMNHPRYGKTLSEEHKRRISESQIGVKNHMYGKTLSEEHKRKISESLRDENNQNK